jgi:hypothetical protein
MVKNNKQISVCYAKSNERFDTNSSFTLISPNSILPERLKALKGLIDYNRNQPRRYFNVLNLYKPGEILDFVVFNR